MRAIFIAALLLFTGACSDADQAQIAKFTVQEAGNSEYEAVAKSVLPKLLNACPGLDRYAADLTQATASKTQQLDFEGGTELLFSVSRNPSTLPPPLKARSAGNRCYITINKEQSMAYIGKRACHSICSGVWQENSPNLMGREYKLQ